MAQMIVAESQGSIAIWWAWDPETRLLFRLLRAAYLENCPQAYSYLIELFLFRAGTPAPEGVFVERRGKPGRPKNPHTLLIYETWVALGKPPLGRQQLAYAIYKAEFTRASSKGRKTLIDRCRRAVERHQATFRPNLSSI